MKFHIKNILRLIRVHHYIKNLFILSPLFFSGKIIDLELLSNIGIAFMAFSFSASAIYILNDCQDIEADRQHPRKRFRPLAHGDISKRFALFLMTIFLTAGISLMATLSLQALGVLSAYITLNIGYIFYLKHIAILDISTIAIGFILRVLVGSTVAEVPLSAWIVIMTFLIALFMALAKRRDDIMLFLNTGKKMRNTIDGYNLPFINGSMIITASVVIVTYILYTTSIEVMQQRQSEYLYLTTLFVILGIMRYLQIAFVENASYSPIIIVIKDKFMLATLLLWVSSFIWIIYL